MASKPVGKIAALSGVVLVAFALAACGSDSSSDSGAEPEGQPTGTTAATPAAESAKADPLDRVRTDLEQAGFQVETQPGSDADSSLLANGFVSVAYYADPAQAKSVGNDIAKVYKQYPGRGIVLSQGHLMIDAGKERVLKPTELATFNRVAAIALKAEQ